MVNPGLKISPAELNVTETPVAHEPVMKGMKHRLCRIKPGQLNDRQQQLVGTTNEITLVLTDIASSTAIWEW